MGRPSLYRETKFSSADEEREINFPSSADHEQV